MEAATDDGSGCLTTIGVCWDWDSTEVCWCMVDTLLPVLWTVSTGLCIDDSGTNFFDMALFICFGIIDLFLATMGLFFGDGVAGGKLVLGMDIESLERSKENDIELSSSSKTLSIVSNVRSKSSFFSTEVFFLNNFLVFLAPRTVFLFCPEEFIEPSVVVVGIGAGRGLGGGAAAFGLAGT